MQTRSPLKDLFSSECVKSVVQPIIRSEEQRQKAMADEWELSQAGWDAADMFGTCLADLPSIEMRCRPSGLAPDLAM